MRKRGAGFSARFDQSRRDAQDQPLVRRTDLPTGWGTPIGMMSMSPWIAVPDQRRPGHAAGQRRGAGPI